MRGGTVNPMQAATTPDFASAPRFVGETEITPEESYQLTGGLSRFGRGAWIASIAVVGWSLFAKAATPVYSFGVTAIAFFASPHLWLEPTQIWPDVPPVPLISLILLGCAVILAMVSVAGVCFLRPILKFLMLKRRHVEIATHVGLAGRSTYEISEDGVSIRNETGAGERRFRFNWSAFDSAATVGGFMRLSYRRKPLAHIALRAFKGEEERVRSLVDACIKQAPAKKVRKLSLVRADKA